MVLTADVSIKLQNPIVVQILDYLTLSPIQGTSRQVIHILFFMSNTDNQDPAELDPMNNSQSFYD
jgi:hypothetical protein